MDVWGLGVQEPGCGGCVPLSFGQVTRAERTARGGPAKAIKGVRAAHLDWRNPFDRGIRGCSIEVAKLRLHKRLARGRQLGCWGERRRGRNQTRPAGHDHPSVQG
jgi:hypothetical protein